jgi:hypothetical protein
LAEFHDLLDHPSPFHSVLERLESPEDPAAVSIMFFLLSSALAWLQPLSSWLHNLIKLSNSLPLQIFSVTMTPDVCQIEPMTGKKKKPPPITLKAPKIWTSSTSDDHARRKSVDRLEGSTVLYAAYWFRVENVP